VGLGREQIDRALLIEVEAAIQRMRAGRYGACERCSGAMYLPRLRSLPWARYCHDCTSQLVAERTHSTTRTVHPGSH
jgi:DnaK suppressor protein